MSLTHTLVQIIDMKEFFLFKPTTNAEFWSFDWVDDFRALVFEDTADFVSTHGWKCNLKCLEMKWIFFFDLGVLSATVNYPALTV
jgi:hypothetical protein